MLRSRSPSLCRVDGILDVIHNADVLCSRSLLGGMGVTSSGMRGQVRRESPLIVYEVVTRRRGAGVGSHRGLWLRSEQKNMRM